MFLEEIYLSGEMVEFDCNLKPSVKNLGAHHAAPPRKKAEAIPLIVIKTYVLLGSNSHLKHSATWYQPI